MSWILPSSISVLVATLIMALIYWYLYAIHRYRHLKLWAIGWSVYSLRFIFLLVEVTVGKALWLTCGYQIAAIVSAILLIWGTQLFLQATMSLWWGALGFWGVVWTITGNYLGLQPMLIVVPIFCLLAFADFQVSYSIWMRSEKPRSLGVVITALNFFLWGVHKLDYPLLRHVEWFAPVGYLLGGLFAMVGALGMVLIFVERMHDSLTKEKEKLRTIMDCSSDGLYLSNLEGVLVEVNVSAAQKLGYDHEELVGKRVSDISVDFDEAGVLTSFRRAMEGERVRFMEHHCRKDGSALPVEVIVSRVDLDGRPFFLGSARDLSAEQLLTEEKRESELKYRSLIECSSDAIFCVDERGEYKFTNHLFSSTFGKTPDYFIGKTFWDIYPKEHADYRYEATKRVFQTGKSESLEVTVPLPDKTLYFYSTADPIIDETGKVILALTHATDITERKLAEEALNESEARYRTLFEDATDGMALADADTGELIDCNLGLCQMVERDKAELVGQMQSILHPPKANHELFSLTFQQHRDLNPGIALEDCLLSKSGKLIPVEIRATRIAINGRDLILGIFRDITERKKNALALKESEEKYSHIVENAPIGIFKRELEGKYHYINQGLVLQLECKTEEEFLKNYGQLSQRWVHPEKHDEFKELLLKNRRIYDYQIESQLISGATKWFSLYVFLDDSNTFINGFSLDITERKLAEERIEQLRLEREQILSSVAEGIIRLDTQGNHVFVNPAAAHLLGYEIHELLGKNSHRLFHHTKADGTPYPERECPIHEAYRDGQIHYTDKEVFWKKNGVAIPVEYNSTPIKENDVTVGAVLSFQDITVKKKTESALTEQSKRLRELSARLSEAEETERRRISRELHDQVGQSLTALGINLNIIRSMDLTKVNANIRQRLDESVMLIEQTAEFTRDMMADLRPPVMDDYGLMASIRWYGGQFSARTGIEFVFKGEDTNPRPDALIEVTLFRIIQESLTNVSKHALAKRVEITGEASNNHLKITIKDNGIGFNPKTVYITDARHHWGITMMAERAESIGGHFSIMSEPGQGSTIVVEAPI